MINLGMPYMGSKRKLAPKILEYIINNNPNCKYFFDLFGGGGAISFMALQYPQIEKVFYNELNTGVVELLRKVLADGVTSEMYQWIDRETFNKHKTDSDWFGGLCKVIWSFGNSQKDYLFGKDKEHKKHLLHNIIVDKCEKSLEELNEIMGLNLAIPSGITVNERRLDMQRYMTKIYKDQTPLKSICSISGYTVGAVAQELQRLEQLQRLERLQLLEGLQQFNKLEISNLSYDEVLINTPIEETIIYLDPPYKNKNEYAETLNHDELADWIKNSPYKIYLSSYEYEGLFEVMQMNHRSIISASTNNKVVEKLFCNRRENVQNSLF